MAEQEAVNFKVVGSNPTRGAINKIKCRRALILFIPRAWMRSQASERSEPAYAGSEARAERAVNPTRGAFPSKTIFSSSDWSDSNPHRHCPNLLKRINMCI